MATVDTVAARCGDRRYLGVAVGPATLLDMPARRRGIGRTRRRPRVGRWGAAGSEGNLRRRVRRRSGGDSAGVPRAWRASGRARLRCAVGRHGIPVRGPLGAVRSVGQFPALDRAGAPTRPRSREDGSPGVRALPSRVGVCRRSGALASGRAPSVSRFVNRHPRRGLVR